MDAFLAVVSKREVRDYADTPVPAEVEDRILQAGRLAGSSRNTQQRRFVVLGPEARRRAAEHVYRATNLTGAAMAVAIVVHGRGPTSFDAGRAAQNMMLAAWNDGVGSCPNGIADPDGMAAVLELADGEQVVNLLSFGYPARPVDPERRSPAEWIERADRLPFQDVVRRI